MKATPIALAWAVCALVGLCAPAAWAAGVWDAGGANTNWGTAENWDDDLVPPSGTDVTFATAGSLANWAADRTAGTITFNAAGGFELARSGGALTINDGITVGAAASYTVSWGGDRMMRLGGPNTWDVPAGGSLYVNGRYFNAAGNAITKTGDGTVYIGSTYQREFNLIDVQGGTFDMRTYRTGGDTGVAGVAGTGTFINSTSLYIGQYSPAVDTNLEGKLLNYGNIHLYGTLGTATMTLSGTVGRMESIRTYPQVIVSAGWLKLDNSGAVNNDRLQDNMSRFYPDGGGLELIGNDTQDVEEVVGDMYQDYGLGTLKVTHGAAASATLRFNRLYSQGYQGMLMFTGNDLAGTGTYYSRIIFHSSVTNEANNNWSGILYGRTRVGDEFAAHDNSVGIHALPAAHVSRVGDINNASEEHNVLVTSAQAPLGSYTVINSLKIDGPYGIDLGGNTLNIDSGGVIQTGSANAAGIHNGTIIVDGPSSDYDGRLFVQTATDLDISAKLSGRTLTKIGAGKLTLSGELDGGVSDYVVRWAEGDLEITTADDLTLWTDITGAGNLYLSGGGAITMDKRGSAPAFPGDLYLTAGMVTQNSSGQLGAGTKHIQNGATLAGIGGWGNYPLGTVSLENGGRLLFTPYSGGYGLNGTILKIVGEGEVIKAEAATYNEIRDLEGDGRLVKKGAGEIRFGIGWPLSADYDRDGFTGILDVAEGKLSVNGWTPAYNSYPANASGLHVRSGAIFEVRYGGNLNATADVSGSGIIRMAGTGFRFVSQGGTWRPGAGVGTLNVEGGLRFAQSAGGQNAALEIEFAGATASDVLAVTGTVDGLNVCNAVFKLATPSFSFDPTGGLTATFVTAASVVGTFTATSVEALPPLNPAVTAANVASYYQIDTADLLYDGAQVALSATAPWTAQDGDANLDDAVDVFDLAVVANHYNLLTPQDWTTADYDLSGTVDVFDLAALANNYGWVGGSGGDPVPEPASAALVLLGLPLVLRRRRK